MDESQNDVNQPVYWPGDKELGTEALFEFTLVPHKAGFSGKYWKKTQIQELSWTQFYNIDASVPKIVK